MNPENKLKLFYHIIQYLKREVDATGFQLLDDDRVILRMGEPGSERTEFPFSSYTLVVGKAHDKLSIEERSCIRSSRNLVSLLLRQLHDVETEEGREKKNNYLGKFRATHGISSLLQLLKEYENKSLFSEYFENIMKITDDVMDENDLSSALRIIIDSVRRVVSGENASLLLADNPDGDLSFYSISGKNHLGIKRIVIPSGLGIAGDVMRTGISELISDVNADPRFFDEVDRRTGFRTENMIVVPIYSGGVRTGVIEVINSTGKKNFSGDDLEFLTVIAKQVGLLIDLSRMREEMKNCQGEISVKQMEMEIIQEILETVIELPADLSPREETLRILLRRLKFKRGAVLMFDPDGKSFEEAVSLVQENGRLKKENRKLYYKNINEVLIWMRDNNAPYMFSNLTDQLSHSDLVQKLIASNPSLHEEGPGLWLPIFDPSLSSLKYIISLISPLERFDMGQDSPTFYRTIMDLLRFLDEEIVDRNKEREIPLPPERGEYESFIQTGSRFTRSGGVILSLRILNYTSLEKELNASWILELVHDLIYSVETTVIRNGGRIEGYYGDTVTAYFSFDDENPGPMAMKTAIEIMQQGHKERDLPDRTSIASRIRLGAGIHAGYFVHENRIKDPHRPAMFLGDSLMIASRLSSLTEYYKADILFTDEILKLFHEPPPYRDMDLLEDPDSNKKINVYQAFYTDEPILRFVDQWNMALEEYRKKSYHRAEVLLSGILSSLPGDEATMIYIKRCEDLIQNLTKTPFPPIFQ